MRRDIIRKLPALSKKVTRNKYAKNTFNKKVLKISLSAMSTMALACFFAADRQAPKISQSSATLDYGKTLSKNSIKISDNRESKKDLIIKVDKKNLNTKRVGTYNIKVKATDSFHNTTTKTIKVKVVDRVAPVIKGTHYENNYILAEAGGSNDLSRFVSVTDNADGDLFKKTTFDKKLDTSKPGLQVIHAKVTDSSGNVTETDLKFKVLDSAPPVIKIKKKTAVNYGDSFNLSDYVYAHDNFDGDMNVSANKELNTKTIGKQVINVSASDSSGHLSTQAISFEVKDLTGPVITLKDEEALVKTNGSFDPVSEIKSVVDNKDGTMKAADVTIEGSVDTSKNGTYTLTYRIKDSSGNESVKKLNVVVSDEGDQIVKMGKNYIGVPYVFGGTTPSGFDCSGFTAYVYAKFGKSLPRTAAAQYSATSRVDKNDLQAGDLVFFSNTYKSGVSHVGIYIGDGKMVDASGDHVQIDDITSGYWASHYTSGGRYVSKK